MPLGRFDKQSAWETLFDYGGERELIRRKGPQAHRLPAKYNH